jgi:phosphoserine phosphatase RsbU/P
MTQHQSARRVNLLLGILVVATLYYVGARTGFLLSLSKGNASPVWLPSGISLAALLLGGSRLWPGIWLGAFLANCHNLFSDEQYLQLLWNLQHGADIRPFLAVLAVACGISTGGTSEALTGAILSQRFIGSRYLFDRGRNVFKFLGIAALSCMVSPTIGVTSLCLGGIVPWGIFGYSWFTWWLGDLAGMLVIAPLLVTWLQKLKKDYPKESTLTRRGMFVSPTLKWQVLEVVLWLLLIGAIAKIAFGLRYPVEYLMIPLLVWAAFRFGRRGATLAIVVVSAIAIIGSINGVSSFIRSTLNESLLLLQAFIGSVTITTLVLSAVITEREQAETELEQANEELEMRVEERTSELKDANEEITRLNDRLKAENIRMAAELAVTRQLQQMILPKESELDSIEQLDISGFMESATEVGGDYYDVLQQEGRIKIGIGDVTGHGLESGVLMIMVQTAVRTLLTSNETDPIKFLNVLNRTIYDNVQRMNSDKNLTLVVLDYQEGRLRLSGQHEEIIMVRAGGILECIDTVDLGFPLGLIENIDDFVSYADVQLNPGDVVVLYTDGIPEAENMNGELYGLGRLCEVIKQNWQGSAAEIRQAAIADVRRHIGAQTIYDDITLVVLKQKGDTSAA